MVANRAIPLEGASNMRDLGGLLLGPGAVVRNGKVYRSAVLSKLTPSDHLKFADLKIATIVDLRSDAERVYSPSRLPPDIHVLTPGDGGVGAQPGFRRRNPRTAEEAFSMMRDGNRTYPERLAAATAATLRAIADAETGAVLFHCAAGKDRTGFIAAMVLFAAGAEEATVMEDYLATNEIWDRSNSFVHHLPEPVREPIFMAREEYLAAALDEVRKGWGSPEAYLSSRCEIPDAILDRVRIALVERR